MSAMWSRAVFKFSGLLVNKPNAITWAKCETNPLQFHVSCSHRAKSEKSSGATVITKLMNKKEPKTIIMNDKIEENDLKSKLNNVKKWLAKGLVVEVNIVKQLTDNAKLEELHQRLVKELEQDGNFGNNILRSKDMRFKITPKPVEKKPVQPEVPSDRTGKENS